MSVADNEAPSIAIPPKVMPSERHLQHQSSLFQLPREIRDLIYDIIFTSTTITAGYQYRCQTRHIITHVKHEPRSLALLRTCRRALSELGSSWQQKVLFDFLDYDSMMDKLTTLSPLKLNQIRHLRIGVSELGSPCMNGLVFKGDFNIDSALKLLPGLCLDILTIHDDIDAAKKLEGVGLSGIDELLTSGDGWRELRINSVDSQWLAFETAYYRRSQPAFWQDKLNERDATGTVTLYRSTETASYNSVLNPSTRELFETDIDDGPGAKPTLRRPQTPDDDSPPLTFAQNEAMLSDNNLDKEVLVIVRRGEGVDCTQQVDTAPKGHAYHNLRAEFPNLAWRGLKTLLMREIVAIDNEEEQRLEMEAYGSDV